MLILKGKIIGCGLQSYQDKDKVTKHKKIVQVLVDRNGGLVNVVNCVEPNIEKNYQVGAEVELIVWVSAYTSAKNGVVVQYNIEGVQEVTSVPSKAMKV